MRWIFGLWLGLIAGYSMAQEPVRYCDYPVYPPISWSDGERVRGLAPQVVKALLAELNLPMDTLVLGNWQRCFMDAQEGRIDLLLAYRSAAREQYLEFLDTPVLREEVALFYNKAKPVRFTRLRDLERHRGGLLFGESYGMEFDRFVARNGNVEYVSSNAQNFGKLIRQRIDFIAHERRTGLLFIERLAGGEQIVAAKRPITVDYLRLAISKNSPLMAHRAELDQALARLQRSGQIERWLHESEQQYRALMSGQILSSEPEP